MTNYGEMKLLSEVCKLIGVTRRTLQEYDRIDLVNPTSKTPAGYWLYDNQTIYKLSVVQLFVEAGYKRKEIKMILDSNKVDLAIDDMIKKLEDNRNRLNGLISLAKLHKTISNLPEDTIESFLKINQIKMWERKSYTSYINEYINDPEMDETDYDMGYWMFQLYAKIIDVGLQNNRPINSNETRKTIESLYNLFINEYYKADISYRDMKETALIEEFQELIKRFINEPEFKEAIISACGKGSIEYILEAVKRFRKEKVTV